MTDEASNTPEFKIEKIYLKDMSFESPVSPAVFTKEWSPEVDFQMNAEHTNLDENTVDFTMNVTVTVKNGEETGFLVEVKQSGVFTIKGFGAQERDAILNVECPTILFPYVRELVSEASVRGGFMPLTLQPISFQGVYAQRLQRMAEEQQAATTN